MYISWGLTLLFTWTIVIYLDAKIEELKGHNKELKKENKKLTDELTELKNEDKGTN